MKVGVLRANLMIPASRSLKEKRHVLRSLKDRLASHFNVSVAEVGAQDLWQRAELGLAFVALDAQSADSSLQKLEAFIRAHPGAAVIALDRAILDAEDESPPDMSEYWENRG